MRVGVSLTSTDPRGFGSQRGGGVAFERGFFHPSDRCPTFLPVQNLPWIRPACPSSPSDLGPGRTRQDGVWTSPPALRRTAPRKPAGARRTCWHALGWVGSPPTRLVLPPRPRPHALNPFVNPVRPPRHASSSPLPAGSPRSPLPRIPPPPAEAEGLTSEFTEFETASEGVAGAFRVALARASTRMATSSGSGSGGKGSQKGCKRKLDVEEGRLDREKASEVVRKAMGTRWERRGGNQHVLTRCDDDARRNRPWR